MKILRRLIIACSILICGVLLAALVTLLYLPMQRDALVVRILQWNGVEVTALGGFYPSLDSTTVESATVRISNTQVSVRKAQLTWKGHALLNPLSTVRFKEVHITPAANEISTPGNFQLHRVHQIALQLLDFVAPAFPVEVGTLILSPPAPSPLIVLDSVLLQPTATGHTLSATIIQPSGPLDITLARKDNAELLLSVAHDHAELFTASLTRQSDVLHSAGSLLPAAASLLASYIPTLSLSRATFSADLTPQQETLRIALDMEGLMSSLEVAGSAELDLQTQPNQGIQLQLRPDLELEYGKADESIQIAGAISGSIQMPLQPLNPSSFFGVLQLRNGKVSLHNVVLDGITAEAVEIKGAISDTPTIEVVHEGSLVMIESFQSGIGAQGIRFRPSLDYRGGDLKLALLDFSAALLGGTIQVPMFNPPLNSSQCTKALAKVSDIQLAEISRLYNSNDLETSGSLSGQLPLEICHDGVMIHGAELRASKEGGHIRYRPATPPQSMAGLDLALQILQNYQYHSLHVEADLAKSGNLTIRLATGGSNPDVNRGHPVNVNVSIEENIPALLKSLRIGGQVAERVAQHHRKRTK